MNYAQISGYSDRPLYGSYWVYQYDSLGQVISGKRFWADGTPVAGQQFEYAFDDIGNRTSTKAGGTASGAGLHVANYTYTNNSLNQITSRDVPSILDIIGAATATATNVNVNGQVAYRRGEYYQVALPIGNTNSSVWHSVTNFAIMTGTTSNLVGNVFLSKSAEVFTYDLDGNLTNDGRWMLTWDGENRLVQIESQTGTPTGSKRKVMYSYDWPGRMIRRTEYNGSSGSYAMTNDLKLLYDGWHCVAELSATDNTRIRSYLWALDLTGTTAGAGGVAGLIAINSVANGTHCHAFDGNGDVAALVSGASGSASANYEYDPFARTIRSTGPMAHENPFRFSTKRTDSATDLVNYEYRSAAPDLGRWLSRDPIAESGGVALYGFAHNDDINLIDPLGLIDVTVDSDGNLIVEVGKCEIVRVIGHGNRKGYPKFLFPKSKIGKCPAAAGFIGCYADNINNAIQGKATLIPGSPKIYLVARVRRR